MLDDGNESLASLGIKSRAPGWQDNDDDQSSDRNSAKGDTETSKTSSLTGSVNKMSPAELMKQLMLHEGVLPPGVAEAITAATSPGKGEGS